MDDPVQHRLDEVGGRAVGRQREDKHAQHDRAELDLLRNGVRSGSQDPRREELGWQRHDPAETQIGQRRRVDDGDCREGEHYRQHALRRPTGQEEPRAPARQDEGDAHREEEDEQVVAEGREPRGSVLEVVRSHDPLRIEAEQNHEDGEPQGDRKAEGLEEAHRLGRLAA